MPAIQQCYLLCCWEAGGCRLAALRCAGPLVASNALVASSTSCVDSPPFQASFDYRLAAARLKMGGNPFAKEGKQDLLAGGSDALRSDDPDWQNQNEEQEPARSAALPAGELAEAAGALEGAPGAAQAPEQLQQQRGAAPVAAYGAQLPPPPPLVPAPLPPGAVSGTLYGDGSSADGRPYYPSAPGASGAWGSGSYEAAAAAAPPQPGFPPTAPGYPLPAAGSMGMYGISSDYQYGAGAGAVCG